METEVENEVETSDSVADTTTESDSLISFRDRDGHDVSMTQDEWKDRWEQNSVSSQYQNLGRDPEDMYDNDTGLDLYGKDASIELSSVVDSDGNKVAKNQYLKWYNAKKDSGDYINPQAYEQVTQARKEIGFGGLGVADKAKAVADAYKKEAKDAWDTTKKAYNKAKDTIREKTEPITNTVKNVGNAYKREAKDALNTISNAYNKAKAPFEKIGEKVQDYKQDIADKAKEASEKRRQEDTLKAQVIAEQNLGKQRNTETVRFEKDVDTLSSPVKLEATYITDDGTSYTKEELGKSKEEHEEALKEANTKHYFIFSADKETDQLQRAYTESDLYKSRQESGEALQGLEDISEGTIINGTNDNVFITGDLTTKDGYKATVVYDEEGIFSGRNLASMFGIGNGKKIGTVTFYSEDGSPLTYDLQNDAKVDNTVHVTQNGKVVGSFSPKTARTFIDGISTVARKVGTPLSINRDSPTVKAAQETIDNLDVTLEKEEKALQSIENATVNEKQISDAYDAALSTADWKPVITKVEGKGLADSITKSSEALEETVNSYKGEDRVLVGQWYNEYNGRIQTALEKSAKDPLGSAGELADILQEAKDALEAYTNNPKFTNFHSDANAYVATVAGTYFIETQLYSEGVTADNQEGLIERIKTARSSDMNFPEKLLYTVGFAKKTENETDEGVRKLRNIAEESLYRQYGVSDTFRGAVMSSLVAQSIDNKSVAGQIAKDTLKGTTALLITAGTGFNPLVVGVASLYALYEGGKEWLSTSNFYSRNENNQQVLEGEKAQPLTTKEKVEGQWTKGTAKDLRNLSGGVLSVIAGLASVDASAVAYGVYQLLQLKSLKSAVVDFVGQEEVDYTLGLNSTDTTESTTTDKEDAKRLKKRDLEENTATTNKQDDLSGINLPSISEQDLDWLARQDWMKGYDYSGS